MTDINYSLVDMGNLADPAKVLIQKVSDAIGGIFKPCQIRRVAQAEAEADKIKAVSRIEISELQQRALNRFLLEEASKQNNIENIMRKALPGISPEAQPDGVENDWIVDFFDKSRLISDDKMQELWSKILAGEANAPGTFSKRTIQLLASLDKGDALLFTKLCAFVWIVGAPVPLIFDLSNEIYKKGGITFSVLKHLDSIGLISFESLTGYSRTGFSKMIRVAYQGRILSLEFPKDANNQISLGHAIFTDVGTQLSGICKPNVVEDVIPFVLSEWAKAGINEVASDKD